MADKRISDFSTLEDIQGDDLLLAASETETYNVKFETIKNEVLKPTVRKVNGATPLPTGELTLKPGDIAARVLAIQYQGTLDGALEELAEETNKAVRKVNGVEPENGAVTIGADDIGADIAAIGVAGTLGQVLESLAQEAMRTYQAKTNSFAAWVSEHANSAPVDYVKTLPDGDYRIVSADKEHILHKFTAGTNIWITEWEYPDDTVCYCSVWCNNTLALSFSNDDGIFIGNQAVVTQERVDALSTATNQLKKNLNDIESDYYDIHTESVVLKPFGDFTASSSTVTPTFCGCALPVKFTKSGKVSIQVQTYSAENGTIFAYICESVPSKISDINPVATASANIATTLSTIVLNFDNGIMAGNAYLVLYSAGRLRTVDLRAYVNPGVLDTDQPAYYIGTSGAFSDAGEGNFCRWASVVNHISITSTEKAPNVDRKIKEAIGENLIKINHIYVATTGSDANGDGTEANPYATIYHANEMITDATATNQYIIHVGDGIYTDLQERYSGSDAAGSYEGVVCKNHVSYIGNIEHPENVVIKWDGLTGYSADEFQYYNYAFKKCPFHIVGTHAGGGVTKVRGFTMDCKNTRYAMHVEMSGYGHGVDWEISDCRFVWHGVPDCPDITYQMPAVGTGSGHFEKGRILRCVWVNDAGITEAFRNHDSQYVYGDRYAVHEGAEIVFESCVLNGGESGVTNIVFRNIHSDGLVDGYNRFSIINCKGINNLKYQFSGDATVCDWRAKIECSDILNNQFATENLLQ